MYASAQSGMTARRVPSGLQPIPSTQSVRLASVLTLSPVSGFQMMQAPLLSTVATRVPSGLQA